MLSFILMAGTKITGWNSIVDGFSPSNVHLRQSGGNAREQIKRWGRPTGSDDDDDDEWRAFRAKLVQSGLPSVYDNEPSDEATGAAASPGENEPKKGRYAYECTPLVEVGSILLSIPTTDLCQALEQQYWHRAVVLITKVSEDPLKGDLETVPDDQLAQGANRGRWSYRGVLLNRFTDLAFDQQTEEEVRSMSENKGSYWNIQRGGDLLGLDTSDGQTEFTCLHHGRSDSNLRSIATKLVGDLSLLSLNDARSLCNKYPTKYTPGDFFTFGGFCSWRPGQLEREMGDERGEWLVLSVDDVSILEELKNQADGSAIVKERNSPGPNVARGLLDIGTGMWRNFLSMINVAESKATERLPSGQLDFYDRMLSLWSEDNLSVDNEDLLEVDVTIDSSDEIGPGALVRSHPYVSNDMLLFESEFIRSLVLVLEDTEEATIGIILNHPMKAAVECVEGKAPIPLRYGGPIDVHAWKDGTFNYDFDGDVEDSEGGGEDDEMYEGFLDYQNGLTDAIAVDVEYDDENEDWDDEDDDSSFIWIHRDPALGSRGVEGGGGSQLGTSDVWIIKENDAIKALQSGFLSLKDVLVFSGVCLWEKGEGLGKCGGGLREQVDALKSFQIVRPCSDQNNDAIEFAWDVLGEGQDILVKETIDSNIKAAIKAWECTKDKDREQNRQRTELSDAVFRAWLGVNLLGDPLGTLVEVTNDQNREVSGQ